jgi:hypothetical protein
MKTQGYILFLGLMFQFAFPQRILAADIHEARPLPENIKRIVDEKNYPAFVRECLPEAVQKLNRKAEAKKAILRKETIKVDEIDNRWYNPSKYVWFIANIETADGIESITVMMQKPSRGKCF